MDRRPFDPITVVRSIGHLDAKGLAVNTLNSGSVRNVGFLAF